MKNKYFDHLHTNIGLLMMRLGFGFFMLYGHGWGKLMKVLSGNFEFGDPLGIGVAPSLILAAFAESICAFLLIIGYKTKWATIPLIITMLVALFFVHLSDPFGRQEKILLYLAGYIAILFTGPGKLSLDYRMNPST
jgi:putative oxidoreductase